MKKIAFTAVLFSLVLLSTGGCAQKRASLGINGMICPEGHTEEQVKADFSACRYYNPEEATKANAAPITIECKECLVKKGYKIGK